MSEEVRIIITEWLVAEIASFFISECFTTSVNIIGKIKNKFKLDKVKKQLRAKLEKDILKKYGDEPFYHEFDCFLQGECVIGKLLHELYSSRIGDFNTVQYFTKVYVEKFLNEHSGFISDRKDLENILYTIYRDIFESLNPIKDDTTRILLNNMKFLIGDLKEVLSQQNEMIYHQQEMIRMSQQKADKNRALDINSQEFYEKLVVYKKSLHQDYKNETDYFEREFSEVNGENLMCFFDKHKRLLLLGEPGSGKTTEMKKILEKVCTDDKYYDLVPINISLNGYGSLFQSIDEVIHKKIEKHISCDIDKLINDLFEADRILLILDGADEISNLNDRNRFYFEMNEMVKERPMRLLITSRLNQYHGNIKNIDKITLCGLNRYKIDEYLRSAGINRTIGEELYDLLQYPLFLKMAIQAFKDNESAFYNKSQLIERYLTELFVYREQEKGINKQDQNLFATFQRIGKIAFEKFNTTEMSISEFDKLLVGSDYSYATISDIFRLDVFEMHEGYIQFSHKQIKEFFAAFYLVYNKSVLDEQEEYTRLSLLEDWQEVMIFVAGIFKDLNSQNIFLDLLLKNNLKTYVRAVKMKNDLACELEALSHEEYSMHYLSTLLRSYRDIVEEYFSPIKQYFEPQIGRDTKSCEKAQIIGKLSPDKKHLTYWFDWCTKDEDSVVLIQNDSTIRYKNLESKATKELRNFETYGVNLSLNKLEGDSARAVAINRIGSKIINITKKMSLIKGDAILCEEVEYKRKKVKFLRELSSIEEMYSKVEDYIAGVKRQCPDSNLVGIQLDGVEMISLFNMLKILKSHEVNLSEMLLPKADKPVNGWIWDGYTNGQLALRVEKFFAQVVNSYLETIQLNFPQMQHYFRMAMDYPIKYKVQIKFNKGDDFFSSPSLRYYYISATNKYENEDPIVNVVDELDVMGWNDAAVEIRSSFFQQGKEVNNVTITDSNITVCLNEGYGKGRECPITAFVYKHIEKDFKELFDL